MTDQHHPITPPPELVQQWTEEDTGGPGWASRITARAAQWGYEQRGEVNEAQLRQARDQELEACCEWLRHKFGYGVDLDLKLRAARRPKPPSLKEQALKELDKVDMLWDTEEFGQKTLNSLETIRRALEALPDG